MFSKTYAYIGMETIEEVLKALSKVKDDNKCWLPEVIKYY